MTRKRSKKQKVKVSDPNSRYRKLMRYVEPKVFYEDNYFSAHGESADTWRVCWLAEKGLFLLFLAAAFFGMWWVLPLLFFPLSLVWSVRVSIDGKAGNGYPEMEAGDAMGIGCLGFLSLVISLIWFFWSI